MNEQREMRSRGLFREIRAIHDSTTVRVYQAYNAAIAEAAVAANSFRAPMKAGTWSATRISWIKPSAVWMAYRCGWTVLKDENQARVLALDVSRSGLERVLMRAKVSDDSKPGECKQYPVVVQWDPERIMDVNAHDPKQAYTSSVPAVRSIQIGLRGDAVKALLDPSVVMRITDVTEDFRNALAALRSGDLTTAQRMLFPDGREESLMDPPHAHAVCERLGMEKTVATGTISEKKTAEQV